VCTNNIAHVVHRRLIIMRHADSIERTDPQTRDHERSITDMGRKAAQQVTLSAVKVIRSLIALQYGVVSCLCMCAMSCQGSSICICNCADMLACGLQACRLEQGSISRSGDAYMQQICSHTRQTAFLRLAATDMAGACCHRPQHKQHALHFISCICLQCFISHV